MATPVWQPSTFYAPGSLVQPATAQPSVPAVIPNASFESGNVEWTLGPNLSIVNGQDHFGPGTWSLRANVGFTGDQYAEMQDFIACTPGESITATCQVQQGASDAGNAGAQILLRFYDGANALIQEFPGNLMENGSGGAWHPSTVTASAPAATASVRIAVRMRRVQQNQPFWVDAFTWNKISQAQAGLIFKAVQANVGLSGSVEPVWPTVNGVQVVDNEVTWEAVLATRITWEAHAILVSGATEPAFVAQEGSTIGDNTIKWVATSRRVTDPNCPNSKIVIIAASKIFAADDDIVPYSATVNPLDWSTAGDAGYLPSNLQQYGANPVSGLGLYRGNLAVMNTEGSQLWQVDEDPAQMALLDAFPVGTAFHDTISPAFNDLFFLPSLGVRTVGIAGGSTNLQSGDAGMPVDPLVQAALAIARPNGTIPFATYLPAAGQYWLVFPDNPPSEVFITGALPDGDINTPTTYQYTTGGGVAPRVVSLVSGALPTGLSINSAGLVTGTRTAGGVFSFQLKVTDSLGSEAFLNDTSETIFDPLWLDVISLLQAPNAIPPTDYKAPLWGYPNVNVNQRPTVEEGTGPFGENCFRFVNMGGGVNSMLRTSTAAGGATTTNLINPLVLRSAYTVEVMFKPVDAVGTEVIWSQGTAGGSDLVVRKVGAQYSVSTQTSSGTNIILGGTVVPGTWQHVALTRSAGNLMLFINGVLIGTVARPEQLGNPFNYGAESTTNFPLDGRLDMMRITGVARYTAPFTPPTRLFPLG